ncbi:MAG: glycerol-3-phosphate 1-O-acyltransferase PlsY [Oscillospiraceae bacterium]|jgi:glycerol-3-phosphate acyltransferase PlsY|nr:glycerol-3-phosphate 1-O-acyltransferase PlsY [Oscillospiraceae bacterium]
MIIIAVLITLCTGYLIGSVSFAVIFSRAFAGKDVRALGSGSAGTTNVFRSFGPVPAVLTAAGDFGKGVLSAFLGIVICRALGQGGLPGAYIAGFGAVVGHMAPVFFGFKGGKSVMTTAGIILMTDPLCLLILFALFALVFLCGKIVSLSSISVAFAYFIITLILRRLFWPETCFAIVSGGLVIFLHRANIGRLLRGEEAKITNKRRL